MYMNETYCTIAFAITAANANGESLSGMTNAAYQQALQAYAAAGATPLIYDQHSTNNLSNGK